MKSFIRWSIGSALSVAACLSGPALAQSTTAEPAAAPACELHVWGGERFQAQSIGLLAGFGVIGAIADAAAHAEGNEHNAQTMGGALATPGQVAALTGLDLPALTGLAGYRIVGHEEPMDPAVANRNRARHAQSASTCYAELMVTRVFYQSSPLYGRTLRASFLFRDFGAAQQPGFTFAGRGGNGLDIFPARNPEQVEAANAELVTVFRANFQEYARNLVTRRTSRR